MRSASGQLRLPFFMGVRCGGDEGRAQVQQVVA